MPPGFPPPPSPPPPRPQFASSSSLSRRLELAGRSGLACPAATWPDSHPPVVRPPSCRLHPTFPSLSVDGGVCISLLIRATTPGSQPRFSSVSHPGFQEIFGSPVAIHLGSDHISFSPLPHPGHLSSGLFQQLPDRSFSFQPGLSPGSVLTETASGPFPVLTALPCVPVSESQPEAPSAHSAGPRRPLCSGPP